ncbi:MFS transporter [Nonomuraea sp. NPDC050663]|uniref:MFS transporter n=1 Tax=Nonomuraea sp. NPDC050663 TaxID=3364370 RepID=UPI00378A75F9
MADHPLLRKNRRFQLLWIGSAVSQLGVELTKLAMPLLVLALTGSPGLAGLVTGAKVAATVLVQLPAGVWVDRWDRRRTLITAQALQLVNAVLLAVLVMTGLLEAWQFLVFGIIDGACQAFTEPARTTAIRAIVPPEQLGTAYAQEESRNHAARLVGPPLGGLLYGIARAVPFVLDAVTYLVALICTVMAKVPRRPAVAAPPQRMHRALGESFAWLWRRRGLREATLLVNALNLLGSAFMIPLIVLVTERGGDARVTGAVMAGIGIGGLAGALLSARIGRLLPPGPLMIAVVAVFGACLVVMALPFGPWWPLLPLMVLSVATPALNVVLSVVTTRLVPEDMIGRVSSVLGVLGRGLAPIGPVLGGTLAGVLGGATSVALIGVVILVTAVVAISSRALRGFTG